MRPVIGVTAIPRAADTSFGRFPHETLPEMYLEMLRRAGAMPVILPVHGDGPQELIARLDGIVLTGGGDVDPALYGHERHPGVKGVDPVRDRVETELVRSARKRDLPILAICRGIQILNVALGGTLVQDIQSQVPEALNHWDPERWAAHSHPISLEPGTKLSGIVGSEIAVNSMHHQAVDRVGPCLRAAGWAPDGVIEAIECPDMRFCIGVQWHPECLGPGDSSFELFRSFIESAKEES